MPEKLSQDLQQLENSGMSAEMASFRLEAIGNLITYGDFKEYAKDMVLLSKRALEAGNVSLSDRLGTEAFTAMGNHALANMAHALSSNDRSGTIQDSLHSIAQSQGFGK